MTATLPGATRLVAALAVVLLAARIDVAVGLTAGLAVAVALLPLWWPSLWRTRAARVVTGAAAACLVTGVWLAWLHADTHDFARAGMIKTVALLLTLVAGIGCVVWARTLTRDWVVGTWFAIGLFAGISSGGLFAVNPWRFGFALPVTVLVLALAMAARRTVADVLAVTALAVVSAVNGGRSTSAVLAMVLVLVLWQARRERPPSALATARTVVFFAALGITTYLAGQAAILEGYLGEDAQARTAMQIDTSGTLLTGGRPEIGASLALLRENPVGFGAGMRPTSGEILVAKDGMWALGYDPDNGYVDNYMFGMGFELHAGISDLWAWFGLPGLVLGIGLLAFLLVRIAALTGQRVASALVLYVGLKSAWNLLFAPLESGLTMLVLAVGLLAVVVPLRAAPPSPFEGALPAGLPDARTRS